MLTFTPEASPHESGESFEVGLGLASPGQTRESQLTALIQTHRMSMSARVDNLGIGYLYI